MRYKLEGIAMAVLVLTAAVLLAMMEKHGGKEPRVHQHLSYRRDSGCDCDKTQLCSHLPLVVINTMGQEIPGEPTGEKDMFGQAVYTKGDTGESVIVAEISVISNESANNHPGDKQDFTTACELRIRGKSSRHFPKKSYALKLIKDNGENQPFPVMGMSAHEDWVLHGPVLDKSLIRNYMWYNISGELMDYAPNVRFCEVILNGVYEGLYLMAESITDGEEGRLNLTVKVKNSKESGYLLRIDRPVQEDLETVRDIYTYSERMSNIWEDVTIRYPGSSNLTPELAKSIELDYAAFEKALFSYDYDTREYGYWNWIDVENFVDYFLINEFTANTDAGSYSTYIYKEVGEKLKLCVWDFNNCCDNYMETETLPEGFFLYQHAWFFMLCKDNHFVQQILKRYEELRSTYLSEEYLMNYIDETLAYLGDAVDRNNQRWAAQISGWNGLEPLDRNVHSHEEALEQLKDWIEDRGEWLDKNIHTLQKFAHPCRNKSYNH